MPRNNQKTVKPFVSSNRETKLPVVTSPLSSVAAPSFGQIVKEGMAFGAGNAVAHQVIGRLFGAASTASTSALTQYEQCMELTHKNQEVCEHLK